MCNLLQLYRNETLATVYSHSKGLIQLYNAQAKYNAQPSRICEVNDVPFPDQVETALASVSKYIHFLNKRPFPELKGRMNK